MSRRIDFVNRTKEKGELKTFASRNNTILVVLEGEGGLGKSRLAEEFRNWVNTQEAFYCFKPLDFDEDELSGSEDLILRLTAFIEDNQRRSDVHQALVEYYALQRMGDSRLAQEKQERLVYQKLAYGLNAVDLNKRKVLFLDTAEKSDEKVRDEFANLISFLDNFLIVIASRPAEPDDPNTLDISFYDDMKLKVNTDKIQVEKIDLGPLDEGESLEFLRTQAKVLGSLLPDFVLHRLAALTGGKPLLLALSVDFVRAEIDFPDILSNKTPPSTQEFENSLVKNIRKIKNDIDRLFLLLSRVYPLNSKDIAYFLGVSDSRADEIYTQACEYTVIKVLPDNRITLHDEMRRLIRAYVWPEYDRDNSRRRRDSHLAADYFRDRDEAFWKERKEIEPQIKDLPENSKEYFELAVQQIRLYKQREKTTEQWLFHALYADLETGWEQWSKDVEKIHRGNKHVLILRLCRMVDKYFAQTEEWKMLGNDADFEFRKTKARANVRLGLLEDAEGELSRLFDEYGNETERRATIRNLQGVLETSRANYAQAKEYQEESLELTPIDNLSGRVGILTQIGYISRMMDEYEDAISYYEEAMDLANQISASIHTEEERKQMYARIASLQTNLAYISGVLGHYDEAEDYLTLARESWKLAERERELALPESTQAIIERDRGQFHSASRRLQKAIKMLKYPDDHRHLCRTYFHLGWTLWFIVTTAEPSEQKEDLKTILEEAFEAFEEARNIADKHDDWDKTPGIYHQLASAYWTYGMMFNDENKKKEARSLNQLAIEFSKKYKDDRYLVDCWAGEIEFDLDEEIRDNLPLHHKHFEEISDKHEGMVLYRGRFLRMFGDFEYMNEQYEKAFEYYAQGFPLMNVHGGYGHYSIEKELLKFREKLFGLDKAETEKWLKYLSEQWKDDPNTKTLHKDLKQWCKFQLQQNNYRSGETK